MNSSYNESQYTNYRPNQFSRAGETTNTIPCDQDQRDYPQRSFNQDTYSKPGFSGYEPRKQKNDSQTKIGNNGSNYLQHNPRHLPHSVEQEKPVDSTVTLKCYNVPDNFKGDNMQRKMRNDGHCILNFKFKHNIITDDL